MQTLIVRSPDGTQAFYDVDKVSLHKGHVRGWLGKELVFGPVDVSPDGGFTVLAADPSKPCPPVAE